MNKYYEYISKYNKEKYDDLMIHLPKGHKSIIKKIAKTKGISMSGYIKELMSDDIDKMIKETEKESTTISLALDDGLR